MTTAPTNAPDVVTTVELTWQQRNDLAAILGDARAYRLGEADDETDPDLDPVDAAVITRIDAMARHLDVDVF